MKIWRFMKTRIRMELLLFIWMCSASFCLAPTEKEARLRLQKLPKEDILAANQKAQGQAWQSIETLPYGKEYVGALRQYEILEQNIEDLRKAERERGVSISISRALNLRILLSELDDKIYYFGEGFWTKGNPEIRNNRWQEILAFIRTIRDELQKAKTTSQKPATPPTHKPAKNRRSQQPQAQPAKMSQADLDAARERLREKRAQESEGWAREAVAAMNRNKLN